MLNSQLYIKFCVGCSEQVISIDVYRKFVVLEMFSFRNLVRSSTSIFIRD